MARGAEYSLLRWRPCEWRGDGGLSLILTASLRDARGNEQRTNDTYSRDANDQSERGDE